MAEPHPQAGLGNAPRTAGQPQIAQRQASIGEKSLNPSAPRVVEQRSGDSPNKPAAKDDEDRSDSDWGLAPAKPGLTRENKFILFVLLVLVAVFSFVVFRNFQKPKKDGTTTEQVADKDVKPDTKNPTTKKPANKSGQVEPDLLNQPGEELTGDPTLAATDSATLAKQGEADEGNPFGASETDGTAGGAAEPAVVQEDTVGFETGADQTTVVGNEPPAQIEEVTEAPAQGAFDVSSEPAETTPPADEAAKATRRNNRRVRGQPVSIETPDVAHVAIGQEPIDATQFGETAEAASASDFTQTGGTSDVEPIGKRGAGKGKDAFAQASTSGVGDSSDMPPTTAPRSGTLPRNATSPRSTTKPRSVITPPPPLAPGDERLGGHEEADVIPRTAGRRTPAPTGQFDSQHEPLVQNLGEYVVKPHDNFWRISRKIYGTPRYFKALEHHNSQHVANPKNMRPGLKILTPSEQQLQQSYHDLIPAPAPVRPTGAMINPPDAPQTPGYFRTQDGEKAYRVGNNESLSSIAHKTLGRSSRWDEIYELNKDRLVDADKLPTATVLRLPQDASQTRVVGKPIETY